jgi:hypothetical protein
MFRRRRRKQNSDWAFAVVLIMLFTAGSFMMLESCESRHDAAHLERLPVMTGRLLANSPPGREVIVEGRISNNMQPEYENFVTYVEKHRQRNSDGNLSWVTEREFTPPLLVDTSEGRVRIEKDRTTSYYTFVEPAYTTFSESDERRYSGFRRDDLIMALGEVEKGIDGMVLDAEFVYGGTRNQYIERQRINATAFFWISSILLVMAVLVVVILLVRQFFRLVIRKL